MDALNCLETRRTIRKFLDKPIEKDAIEQIVHTAQMAPSWKNYQPTRFTAITGQSIGKVEAMLKSEGTPLGDWNEKIVGGCALLFAVSVEKGLSGYDKDGSPATRYGDGYTFFDCGCAVENLCLAAHEKGIGTVILGHFDIDAVSRLIELPENENLVVLVACGYPAESPQLRGRNELSRVLRYI